jgi:hypothetical protein
MHSEIEAYYITILVSPVYQSQMQSNAQQGTVCAKLKGKEAIKGMYVTRKTVVAKESQVVAMVSIVSAISQWQRIIRRRRYQ